VIVRIQIKDASFATIVSHVVSVAVGGREMNCNCICHNPEETNGRICIMCSIIKNGCEKHLKIIGHAPENLCWCGDSRITDCYRCHLQQHMQRYEEMSKM
jgi:hypothetical protein